MPRQIIERVGGAPQHVEARAHGVGVVPQRVDAVLLRNQERVALRLLDEPDQERDRGVLEEEYNY